MTSLNRARGNAVRACGLKIAVDGDLECMRDGVINGVVLFELEGAPRWHHTEVVVLQVPVSFCSSFLQL
jgi:hypothetical protein